MNHKIAVIYQSYYDTTKQYAKWISKELGADLIERNMVLLSTLNKYDLVIYGGGLYVGGIIGVDLFSKSSVSRFVIFTVGLADPKDTDYAKAMTKSFPNQSNQPLQSFHFRGGIDYSKLSFMHRNLMKLLGKMVAKKPLPELTSENKAILETYGKRVNFTDKSSIEPLVSFVKEVLK
ncbi:flavodoxin domain-containing protein [Lactobacillus sp. UCMA15818]|uniref:flavodoxin domain-containing protein n=1 Tax=Lactobacillus sp. UCMA15818 TaxID=2583394 RepID=UPI0025B09C9B|nr:flavodoxin domain-containing protein [Lactobacillus sp. UCMA15818]MDN2453567.1 flavodoxin [Lactobacillus sp. UCMA15818]